MLSFCLSVCCPFPRAGVAWFAFVSLLLKVMKKKKWKKVTGWRFFCERSARGFERMNVSWPNDVNVLPFLSWKILKMILWPNTVVSKDIHRWICYSFFQENYTGDFFTRRGNRFHRSQVWPLLLQKRNFVDRHNHGGRDVFVYDHFVRNQERSMSRTRRKH